MRKFKICFAILALALTFYSILACKTPPGQAKKVTGSQSAKTLAPGQQK